MLPNFLYSLPIFFSYFAMAVLLLSVFWSVYTYLTPHDEMALIRQGNIAAAVMLAGALIGFAIPVGAAIANNISPMALAQWGLIAMLVQWSVFSVLRLLVRDLMALVQQNNVAIAVMAASLSIAIGLLNAGAQSV